MSLSKTLLFNTVIYLQWKKLYEHANGIGSSFCLQRFCV